MFKKSTTNRQIDFLSDVSMQLDEKRSKTFNDPHSWHNQFFHHVVCNIDEECFKDLYSQRKGRPNAPVRILVGMLALKEGHGWSDAQLFEQLHFNLLVMKALGFENISDKVPSPSTYYLFKQTMYDFSLNHGRNLMMEAFQAVTKSQVDLFGVNGQKIRMDSKLIGSNIVCCTRLRLIISCLQAFWKSLSDDLKDRTDTNRRIQLDELCQQQPHQVIYPLSEEEKSQKLVDLGKVLLYLKNLYDDIDHDQFKTLKRLFSEQYEVKGDHTQLKPAKAIAADSIQSPHDPDAAYRRKRHQSVMGNSVNITETCNPNELNLIVDVQVEKATHADKDFMQPALNHAMEILGSIDEVYLDGAYQSQDNLGYGKAHAMNLVYTGISGAKGRYEYEPTDLGLLVYDRHTNQYMNAIEYKPGHYKIRQFNGSWRYIKAEEIDCYKRRKAIEHLPLDIKHRRNNVEASLFQLAYHVDNNKTRYRENFRNSLWAISRTVWLNLVRIKKHVKEQFAVLHVAPS